MAGIAVTNNPLKPETLIITCSSDSLNDFRNGNGYKVGFS